MSSQVLVSKIRRKYKETTLLKTRYFMLHLETKIQILYFCDKKYRRAIVTEMIIKPKLSTKRKDSHSRQHHSNLRSNSKSSQKNKQRSDSKLLLKLKQGDPTQNPVQPPKMYNYQVLNRINLKKATSSKQLDNDNEYYNHFKNKSKSKGKIQPLEEQAQRQKYLTSVYMHKDSVDAFSNSNLQQSNKCIEIEKPGTEKNDKAANTHLNIINKFKLIEKNCGIDANGKFTSRQAYKSQENTKNTESFNAISMFQVQKKTEKFKKKDKLRRDIVKSAKSKKIEDKLALKLNIIRSAEKTAKKKDFKQVNSPCLAECQAETEIFENGIIKQTEKEQKIPKVSFLNNIIIKTTLLQETRTSPNQIQDVQRVQFNINIEEIVSLIEEQKKCNLDSKKLKRIFPNDLLLQRKKCIKFISKICSDFGARREAHSLAIFYMDKYLMIIDQQVNAKQLKLIVMTSLLLALKMDDGIMARRVCHQYLSNMQNLINKCEVKNKSLQKQKQLISTFSSRQNSGSMIKSKSQSSFGDSNTTKGDQTKKSRNQQIVHSKQMTIILSLQLDIMMKFNFKMVSRSSTYWVDTLSALWDNYVCQEMKNEFQLLFRHEKNKRNLSHLYQIVQKMQQQLEVYQFSKPHIVLSSMYLIIRMRLQQQKEGQTDKKIYSKYSQSLNKSTNLIFYDNVGINELFGDFLEQLDMNISNLIECIRFVGKFLTEDFKTFSFNSRGKQILNRLYEHYLSIYQQNASLYKEEP